MDNGQEEIEAMGSGAAASEVEDVSGSGAEEGDEAESGEMEDGDSASQDDIFKNNHDLIGVQGILKAQRDEIEKKKLELRMSNERYFR